MVGRIWNRQVKVCHVRDKRLNYYNIVIVNLIWTHILHKGGKCTSLIILQELCLFEAPRYTTLYRHATTHIQYNGGKSMYSQGLWLFYSLHRKIPDLIWFTAYWLILPTVLSVSSPFFMKIRPSTLQQQEIVLFLWAMLS